MNIILINVSFENGTCEVSGINLITGDYNSTVCKFTFDKEDGTKIFKMKNPNDETVFEREIIDNEVVLTGYDENDEPASIFNSEGDYGFEVNLYDNDGRLTSSKGVISVEEELVKEDDTEIEVYKPLFDQLMGQLNDAITETNNLDIDAEKVDTTTTITITKKDGTQESVEILDGEKGEDGEQGRDGITPNIQVGTTTTLPAGSNATVSQRGTAENPIFDFGIPKGEDGQGGGTGDYADLTNKPKINNVELVGNKTTSDLGINIPDVSNFITKDVDNLTNYYKKTETYTKTEVDNKVSSVYRYRGTVATYSDLPSTDLVIGDVYNVEQADSQHGIEAGDNVAWNGTVWDKLSGNVDLSGYQPLLVSGTNIKTVNNTSLLGSGDINTDIDILVLEYNDNSDEAKAKATRIINKFYGKTAIGCVINTRPVLLYCNASQQQASYYFSFDGILDYSNRRYYKFHVNGTWDNNVFTCTSISYEYEESASFFAYALSTKNTTSYTPSVDSYKPATAKYAEQMVQSVAPVYSTSSTYAVGDFVSYQGKLYKCNTAITTAESWTAGHWTETNVVSEMGTGGSVSIDNSSITKNSSDEIQTVGIIDNNSGNTNKIWTGTLAQYNAVQSKDADTFYYITDDDATSTLRQKVEVITSSDTSYTIANLTANKSYKLGELTALTITACETFDEESVIYFDSGSTATVLSLPNDVVQIGDTTIEASKSYIISILNKIAVIKAYEVS